jgi:hypothetical protein
MSIQESLIELTEYMLENLFRNARAMPEDKLEWKPMDNGRTVLDQLQECAQVSNIFKDVLETRKPPNITEEIALKNVEVRSQWKTIDDCETHAKENSEKLFEAMRAVPDDEVATSIEFAPGYEVPIVKVMSWHYQNLTYHLGQISYIQTLYGDIETH